jgi:hypothetical protein
MNHTPHTETPVWPAVELAGRPASGRADPEPAPAPRHGHNAEQQARIAARRALVTLKQSFMRAVDELSGPDADWLHRKVRQANDSTELWRLRPTIFALLPEGEARSALHRNELNRQLDSVFPESSAVDSVPPIGGLTAIPPQLRPR